MLFTNTRWSLCANKLILRVQPLFPMAIRGIPKYPGKHLSHKFPPTPGRHEQWPEIRSQVVFTLPVFRNKKGVQSGLCNLSKNLKVKRSFEVVLRCNSDTEYA